MKKLLFASTFLFIILSSSFVSAQETKEQPDMMKAWQEYMTPGPMHQMLAAEVGEWITDVKMWMDPSQPPTTTQGTSVCDSILGGRYFQTKHSAMFNNMPMNGIEIVGYDNAKKTFFSTWIDNFGTGIMLLEGKYDEASKTITYTGTATDPLGKEIKVRQTVKRIDKDNLYSEMFMNHNGQEFKSMEIKMTRKKS